MSGLYVVFEGSDGAGKTSTMKAVAEVMPDLFKSLGLPEDKRIHLTHHPGSTPLGAHLRRLVKQPETIDATIEIDPLSRQMLYMVDCVSFAKSILEPALDKNELVFADRSVLISALVYGCAEGMSIAEVQRLFALYEPPRVDRLYILRCPWSVAKERMIQDRGESVRLDHFDRKPDEFFDTIASYYDNLIPGSSERIMAVSRSVSLSNVIYIDATQPIDRVVDEIVGDLSNVLSHVTSFAK
jgi:dTMP kinase